VLILWRNERERALPLPSLIDAFALKTEASLARLEREIDALSGAAIDIGQIAIGCALGYLDYRFEEVAWRAHAPKLAAWYATLAQRPSFIATEPADG
jgi:glutathione S-transferase